MCNEGSAFTHGFFVASLRVNSSSIKGYKRRFAPVVVQHDVTYDGIGTSPTSFGIL